jgi:hypothetical protein
MSIKIFKSFTLEKWRQLSNEIAINLGTNSELDNLLTNNTFNYIAENEQILFVGLDANNKTLNYEVITEASIDNSGGYIILKDVASLPASFAKDAFIYQGSQATPSYSAEIVSVSNSKILVKNSNGNFNSQLSLFVGVDELPEENILRIIGESYPISVLSVFKNDELINQGLGANEWHSPIYTAYIPLNSISSGSITDFIEGEIVFQGINLSSATWSGTVLSCDTEFLRIKSFTGAFSSTVQIKLLNSSQAIVGANHGDLFQDSAAVEFNTPLESGDEIVIKSTNLVNAVNELQLDLGSVELLNTTNKTVVGAINEHDAELGTITSTAMGTVATTVSGAIREHEDQIGNIALTTTSQTLRGAVNELDLKQGSASLTTLASNISSAINEHDAELGTITSAAMGTTATTVSGAIKEHEDQIGNITLTTSAQTLKGAINELDLKQGAASLTTSASNISSAINEHDAELGTISSAAMGTTASTVSGAIKEHEDQIGNVDIDNIAVANDTITGALKQLHDEIGESTLTTTAQTLSAAINEHDAEIGVVNNLTTTSKVLVGAVNELKLKQGSAALDTTATNLSAAINELHTEVNQKINASSGSTQTLNTNLTFTAGNIVQFPENAILDIRDGSLLVGGGAGSELSFNTAFIELTAASTIRGLSIERGANDAAIQWNESKAGPRGWELVGVNESLNALTADIITFYNAKDLISNNTESGINVTWDAINQNFDFDVNDPVITLSGHVSGSATMTNLSNTTINVTVNNVADNAIALGTKTTGNYVATIAGTTNEIEVSGSGSETAAVTIGLPNNVTVTTDLTVGRDLQLNRNAKVNGTLIVDGNVTLGNATTDTVTIAGNLIVQGDQTILNTATLEVEDSIIITNANNQAVGEFGLAVEGTTDGVIEHTLYYNYTSGQWEADGNKLLDVANLGSPTISGLEYQVDDNLAFANGAGISQSTAKSGDTITHTITNTDRGSSQAIFKNITSNSGSTTANINNDTLSVVGGTYITTSISGDTLTITHADTSNQASVDNSAGTVIQDITVDGAGHVTDIGSVNLDNRYQPLGTYDNYSSWNLRTAGTSRLNVTSGNFVSFNAGGGLNVQYGNNVVTYSHVDTSSQASVNNSNGVVIQDITLDTYGHITSLGSVNLDTRYQAIGTYDNYSSWRLYTNGTDRGAITSGEIVNIAANNGVSLSYSTTNNAITLSHADTSSQGSMDNSLGVVIQDITLDGYGHITSLGSVDLDDRYQLKGTYDNYSYWNLRVNGTSQVNVGSTNFVSFNAGGGLNVGYANNVVTISHADTSTVGNLSASGRRYVTGLTFDTYGHVQSVSTGTETVVNTDTNYYVSGGSYSSGTLTLTRQGLTNVTVTGFPTNNNQLTNGAGYVTSSGSVAFATTAGSANSVAGANVTGTVASATTASTAGSATTAGTATVANSVDNINSASNLTFWTGNQLAYDLATKNANTLYFVI